MLHVEYLLTELVDGLENNILPLVKHLSSFGLVQINLDILLQKLV